MKRKTQRFALAFALTFAVTAVTVLPGSVVTASPAEAGIFSLFGGGLGGESLAKKRGPGGPAGMMTAMGPH